MRDEFKSVNSPFFLFPGFRETGYLKAREIFHTETPGLPPPHLTEHQEVQRAQQVCPARFLLCPSQPAEDSAFPGAPGGLSRRPDLSLVYSGARLPLCAGC